MSVININKNNFQEVVMAVNANALDDYGGKTSIAFCQACGKAFIKRGNRQKYCGTMQCQSVRNNRKSSDFYYRKKKDEQENNNI